MENLLQISVMLETRRGKINMYFRLAVRSTVRGRIGFENQYYSQDMTNISSMDHEGRMDTVRAA